MKSAIFILTLVALSAFGVSRVGGGKVSSTVAGFQLEVPQPFFDLQQFQDVVVANGPMFISDSFPMQQFIQIREFSNYYAKLAPLSRTELEAYFLTRGFVKNLNVPNPCIDAYVFDGEDTTGIVASWGQGKGVTLTGPSSPLVKTTVESILQNMALTPGACSWK